MQSVNELYIPVTTTGSAGSATGETTTDIAQGIRGFVWAIHVKPNGSLPNTSDITISEVGGAARTLLTLTNAGTTAKTYPVRIVDTDNTGSDLTSRGAIALGGTQIKVAIAQSDALTKAVEVWVYILR